MVHSSQWPASAGTGLCCVLFYRPELTAVHRCLTVRVSVTEMSLMRCCFGFRVTYEKPSAGVLELNVPASIVCTQEGWFRTLLSLLKLIFKFRVTLYWANIDRSKLQGIRTAASTRTCLYSDPFH